MGNNSSKKANVTKHVKELKKTKVYYFKDSQILFENNGKIVKLKEFHKDGLDFVAPFSEEEAKLISRINGAYLKIKR